MVKRLQKKKGLTYRKKLETIVWFLVKFNLLAIPLYVVIYLNLSFEPLQIFLASLSQYLIKAFGYAVSQNGFFLAVLSNNQLQQIEISWDSTGWKSLYALLALAIATPIPNYKKKINFLSIGLPLIFVINFVRIVTTILVSLKFGFKYFDVVHTILWREGLILAVVGIWLLWLWKEKHNIR